MISGSIEHLAVVNVPFWGCLAGTGGYRPHYTTPGGRALPSVALSPESLQPPNCPLEFGAKVIVITSPLPTWAGRLLSHP